MMESMSPSRRFIFDAVLGLGPERPVVEKDKEEGFERVFSSGSLEGVNTDAIRTSSSWRFFGNPLKYI